MTDATPPEPDRVEGAPHPRQTVVLYGQEAAERAFLEALASGRLHHGWLIEGPRGVGKATLAWRIARALLAAAPGAVPASLDVDPDDPVARRVAALSEPRLALVRRPLDQRTGRLRQEITVDEIRRLRGFFSLSAADGGRRVVIIDAADEMNVSAANALLKILEEPPKDAVLLLVSHRPARLLPTIRSRCRSLRCATLDGAALSAALAAAGSDTDAPEALAALSAGSVGEAVRLVTHDGLALYADLVSLLAGLPRIDRARARAIADSVAARGAEPRLDLLERLFDILLARLAHHGAGVPPPVEAAPGEFALLARLAPDAAAGRRWAELQQEIGARLRRGRAVNLDPAGLILDTTLRIEEMAAMTVAR